jgi:outer membrane lipoprotein-sorting protein
MKKALLGLLLCLSLCQALLPATVFGGPAGKPGQLQSVQADFIQEKHLKILARPLVSRGVFAFQAPQSLRWEYRSPLHSILLMHGGRIEKMIERDGRFERDNGAGVDSMQIILKEISSWLDGRFSDNPVFSTTHTDERTVVLVPKEKGLSAMISRIELRLGEQQGLLDSVTIYEGPDAFTRLTFANTALNREIPESFFTVQ